MKDVALAIGAAVLLIVYVGAEVVGNLGDGKVGQRAFLVRLASVIALMFVAAGLASCSTPTVVKTETVEVKVPVAVQPIKPDQVPQPPAPLGKRPNTAPAAADVALAKVCEFVAYALKADPLLRISAGGKPVDLPRYPECER